MPTVPFDALPDDARVWIFASDKPLDAAAARVLLDEVDRFLESWKAHGAPLRNARAWRDDRFLVIGVDPTVEQASGCSIDGMFRVLQQLEQRLETGLVAGGRIFFRDASGAVQRAQRAELGALAAAGQLRDDTTVFDTSITDAAAYRTRFEQSASRTWVGSLLARHASHASSRSATKSSSDNQG